MYLVQLKVRTFRQRTLTVGGRITVRLVSSLTRLELTNEGNIILFVFSESVLCNLVKLETSCTLCSPNGECSLLWVNVLESSWSKISLQ